MEPLCGLYTNEFIMEYRNSPMLLVTLKLCYTIR